MNVDFTNLITTVSLSTVFSIGAAYGGVKFALKQNAKDHEKYDRRMDKLESQIQGKQSVADQSKYDRRVEKVEENISVHQGSIIELFTKLDSVSEAIQSGNRTFEKLDTKLDNVSKDIEFIRGKMS